MVYFTRVSISICPVFLLEMSWFLEKYPHVRGTFFVMSKCSAFWSGICLIHITPVMQFFCILHCLLASLVFALCGVLRALVEVNQAFAWYGLHCCGIVACKWQ